MARIKDLGELEFVKVDSDVPDEADEDYDCDGCSFVCHLFLDQPIKIEGAVLEHFENHYQELGKSWSKKYGFHDWSFPEVHIFSDGTMLELDQFADPDNIPESASFVIIKNLLPKILVDALSRNKACTGIGLTLYHDLRRSESEHLCDLAITVDLLKMVRNTDKFFQSFARKLNKWLAETRKSAV